MKRRDEIERGSRALWILLVLTITSGVFGLVGFFREGESSWPRPFAFGWCAVFATGLVIEIVRRRRAAQLAAAAGEPRGKHPRDQAPRGAARG